MSCRKVMEDIYSVGAIDWNRRLFDELIPLPGGTSYNSYVIEGSESRALIDTVEKSYSEELLRNLDKLDVDQLDYIVSNHSEQDHSGALPEVMKAYPEAEILTGEKGLEMLEKLLHIDTERITTVKDGEEISLGDKTLRFYETPWAHWPETISTFIPEKNILFPCDLFGSHLATSSLFVDDEARTIRAAKRYYAQIMMPYRLVIDKNVGKLQELDIDMIAPSHGPIYQNPELIMSAYEEWINGPLEPEVIVPYISMHGSTEELVSHFVDELMSRGVKVKPFNLREVELGSLAMALVQAAAVVVGSPTVLGGPHPKVSYAVTLANALNPRTKYASIIGSCGWGGNMVDQITGSLDKVNPEIIDPVLSKGKGGEENFAEIERLAEEIGEKLAELSV